MISSHGAVFEDKTPSSPTFATAPDKRGSDCDGPRQRRIGNRVIRRSKNLVLPRRVNVRIRSHTTALCGVAMLRHIARHRLPIVSLSQSTVRVIPARTILHLVRRASEKLCQQPPQPRSFTRVMALNTPEIRYGRSNVIKSTATSSYKDPSSD
uniref:Uncharacterized protein n=1 Tax=Mycena chlorophos TaxID=658473 RepID=A0ABQ0LL24_MYCCL|nr:predicted protein [Mycena chlorophos]